ncbi:MAG: fructose-6-phosphate aldolase [Bacteroidota bacterium]
MYFLKIKGKARIPDFIQVRGDDFTLIGYFRMDTLDKNIIKYLPYCDNDVASRIRELPYGRFLKAKN